MATGLITNQIGCDPRFPSKILFRSRKASDIGRDCKWRVYRTDATSPLIEGTWEHWGALWKENWWHAQCSLSEPGSYRVETMDSRGTLWSSILDIEPQPYLRKTFEHVALDQFERRSLIPTAPDNGWIDCGAHLSEANSHAVSVIGMCLFYRERGGEIPDAWRERLLQQIRVGCDFFQFLATGAIKAGLPKGTYQHEPVTNPHSWVIQDCLQIGIALCKAVSIFRALGDASRAEALLSLARSTVELMEGPPHDLILSARRTVPADRKNGNVQIQYFSEIANALPEGTEDPSNWMTRELALLLWLQLEYDSVVDESRLSWVKQYADALLGRWHDNPHPGKGHPKGWFTTFPGVTQAETSWSHHSVGRDTGAVFPQFVMPMYEASLRFPQNASASKWREAALRYLADYLKPASQANPFSILPNTFRENDSWLHFAGLWHGMNGSYGLAALQAFYFHRHMGEDWLFDFGKAQLDWIAGLNCGLTAESLHGSVMYSCDIPPQTALPVSMIHGVGHQFAGSWRTIRGSICNGFSRGRQFNFDVEPVSIEDQPDSFTDEDWITHAGAWIGALAYCDL